MIATVSKGRKTVCIVVEQKKLLCVIRSGLVGRKSLPTIEPGVHSGPFIVTLGRCSIATTQIYTHVEHTLLKKIHDSYFPRKQRKSVKNAGS